MFKISNPNYFLTKEGLRLFYHTNFNIIEGENYDDVLIFNYGLLCSNEHWKYQLPYFDKLGYKILIHDYRCHFNSTCAEGIESCNFQSITSDLKEMCDGLGITSSYMIGHSMGVNVTLEFAKTYPDFLKGMVIISGTVTPPQEVMFNTKLMDKATPALKYLTKSLPEAFEFIWESSHLNPLARRAIFAGGFNTEYAPAEFVDIYMKKISELPKELFLHLLDLMKDHQIADSLQDIRTKTLIIGGDKDKVIPNYLQFILEAKIPNSELYIVKDGSHVPQVDFPGFLNERIEFFLNS